MHYIETSVPVLEPEDGLILGNGDLSVSIYQTSDLLIWRFGKVDVWDRRLDLDVCPEPAHIDELARGIRDEGWVSHEFVYGEGEATKGECKDPKRMKEICDGWPAYARRPYPCPKPVGELAMHLPVDMLGMQIHQKLTIERGQAEIIVTFDNEAVIHLQCFIAPEPNALVVRWRVENWNDATAAGRREPVWFSLYRWMDPPVEQLASSLHMRARYPYFWGSIESGECTTLPAPQVKELDGQLVIEQQFYPDLEFDEGFRYLMAPFVTGLGVHETTNYTNDAVLNIFADEDVLEGEIAVAITTSTDDGGPEAELARVREQLAGDLSAATRKLENATHALAEEFWSKSSVTIDHPVLENAWYEMLHIRRCTYRGDVVAPGLALPSTVKDYSLWHGDYHMNINYQMCFWGDYISNHIDLGDSFFPGMDYMVDIGRKLARDYWGARGTFIQLAGYPFPIADDPYGTGALCRMTYMTGWVSGYYWWRYRFTLDREWLEQVGYPVIRDCGLFYLDFLEKRDDGKYHAWPSMQGESMFTGKVEDYTDRPQVVRHARYGVQCALRAAQALGVDEDLQAQWQDVLDNLVAVDDLDALGYSEEKKRRYALNPPAFVGSDVGDCAMPAEDAPGDYLVPNRDGCGFQAWPVTMHLHNDAFVAERDIPNFAGTLKRWRRPGGMMRAWSMAGHSYIGAYGESLGMLGPLQEFMLQSWDEVVRLFPNWKADIDASFANLRAEGAFLISAEWKDGALASATIHSERGAPCRLEWPWESPATVTTDAGQAITLLPDPLGVVSFNTEAGVTYTLVKA